MPVQEPVRSDHVADPDFTTAPAHIPIEPVRDVFDKEEEEVMTTKGVPIEQLKAQADAELKAAKAKGKGKDYVRTDKDGNVVNTTGPKVVGPPSPSDEAIRAAKGELGEEEEEEQVKHEEEKKPVKEEKKPVKEEKKPAKEEKKPVQGKKKPPVDIEEEEEEKKAPKVGQKETQADTPEEIEADRVREKLFSDN